MKLSLLAFFFLLGLFSTISAQKTKAELTNWGFVEENDVVTLSEYNFNKAIEKFPYVFVEFYATWCQTCKKVVKDVEKTAKELKRRETPIMTAKVDVDSSPELADLYGVSSTPTFILFVNGQPIRYAGDFSYKKLTIWAKHRAAPFSHPLPTHDDVTQFYGSENIVAIFFGEESSPQFQTFVQVAETFGRRVLFGHCFDEEVRKMMAAQKNSAIIIKKFDERRVDLEGELTSESLVQFVKKHQHPILTEISNDNYELAFNEEQESLVLAVYNDEPLVKEFKKKIVPVLKDEANLSILDGTKGLKKISRMIKTGTKKEDLPTARILNPKTGEIYAFPEKEIVNSQNILQFWKDYKAGKIRTMREIFEEKRTLEKHIEAHQVVELNHLTWDKIVLDQTKDVFVLFYAKWCGHCKALMPIWEKFAHEMGLSHDIIIARIDAERYDGIGGHYTESYPTLKFFPTNDKTGILYRHQRSLENLIRFLHEKGT